MAEDLPAVLRPLVNCVHLWPKPNQAGSDMSDAAGTGAPSLRPGQVQACGLSALTETQA